MMGREGRQMPNGRRAEGRTWRKRLESVRGKRVAGWAWGRRGKRTGMCEVAELTFAEVAALGRSVSQSASQAGRQLAAGDCDFSLRGLPVLVLIADATCLRPRVQARRCGAACGCGTCSRCGVVWGGVGAWGAWRGAGWVAWG